MRRIQKRNKRRLLEAPADAWKLYDKAAKLEGLNWSEFTRRALITRCASVAELEQWANDQRRTEAERLSVRDRLPGLSEKPSPKNGAGGAAKTRPSVRRGKGSSRS